MKFSYEIFPKLWEGQNLDDLIKEISDGDIFVTVNPNHYLEQLNMIKKLLNYGILPKNIVPHLSCELLITDGVVEHLLEEYNKIGIQTIFVLRGDNGKVYSTDLMKKILKLGYHFKFISCFHPQGHPNNNSFEQDIPSYINKYNEFGVTELISQIEYDFDLFNTNRRAIQEYFEVIPTILTFMPNHFYDRIKDKLILPDNINQAETYIGYNKEFIKNTVKKRVHICTLNNPEQIRKTKEAIINLCS